MLEDDIKENIRCFLGRDLCWYSSKMRHLTEPVDEDEDTGTVFRIFG